MPPGVCTGVPRQVRNKAGIILPVEHTTLPLHTYLCESNIFPVLIPDSKFIIYNTIDNTHICALTIYSLTQLLWLLKIGSDASPFKGSMHTHTRFHTYRQISKANPPVRGSWRTTQTRGEQATLYTDSNISSRKKTRKLWGDKTVHTASYQGKRINNPASFVFLPGGLSVWIEKELNILKSLIQSLAGIFNVSLTS